MAWVEVVLYLTGFVLLVLLIFAFTRLKNQLAPLYMLMLMSVMIYVIGYGREIGSHSVEEVKFWLKFEYFGISFITTLWFIITYKIHYGRVPSFSALLALFVVPVLTVFFSSTNDYLHFYYKSVTAINVGQLMIAQLDKGPWYYVFTVYSNAIFLFSLVINARHLKVVGFHVRTRVFWMTIGSLFATIVEIIYLFGFSPYNIDLTPFGFLGAALCQGVAIFNFDFLKSDDLVKDVVFANIKEGLLILDADNRISDFNKTTQQIYPWLNVECIGKKITNFEDGQKLCEFDEQKSEIGVACGTKHRFFDIRMTELIDNGKMIGKVYLFKDVTSMRRIMHKLYRYANYDTLTRIFNRRRFFDDCEKEISRCIRYEKMISLIMIDLDHFKRVNDQYGHQAGDKVLYEVAQVMRKRLRRSDILGRYGGEEFGIMLVETEPQNGQIVADDIRKSIESLTIVYKDIPIKITASVGLAASDGKSAGLSLERLLNSADKALYQAKEEGGNMVRLAL
ncbi:MAG: diguanylate cyclase [Spirochaetaceae bacterium]|nr:diguanylate cyclase [Spirochaetaceae bacterium]